MEDTKITFGRHNGRTLGYMLERHRDTLVYYAENFQCTHASNVVSYMAICNVLKKHGVAFSVKKRTVAFVDED